MRAAFTRARARAHRGRDADVVAAQVELVGLRHVLVEHLQSHLFGRVRDKVIMCLGQRTPVACLEVPPRMR